MNCFHMEMSDDCFMFASIASLILIEEKEERRTEKASTFDCFSE